MYPFLPPITFFNSSLCSIALIGRHAYASFPTTNYFLLFFSMLYCSYWKPSTVMVDGLNAPVWMKFLKVLADI